MFKIYKKCDYNCNTHIKSTCLPRITKSPCTIAVIAVLQDRVNTPSSPFQWDIHRLYFLYVYIELFCKGQSTVVKDINNKEYIETEK